MSLEQTVNLDELKITGRPKLSWWLRKHKKKLFGAAVSAAALVCALYGGFVFYQNQKIKATEKFIQANNIEEIRKNAECYKQVHQHSNNEFEEIKRQFEDYKGSHSQTNSSFSEVSSGFSNYKTTHARTNAEFQDLEGRLSVEQEKGRQLANAFETYKKKCAGIEELENLVFTQQKKLIELGKRLQVDVFPIGFEKTSVLRMGPGPFKIMRIDDAFYMQEGNNVVEYSLSGEKKGAFLGCIDYDQEIVYDAKIHEKKIILTKVEKDNKKSQVIAFEDNQKYNNVLGVEIISVSYDHNRFDVKFRYDYECGSKGNCLISNSVFFEGENPRVIRSESYITYKGMRYDASNGGVWKTSPQGDRLWIISEPVYSYYFMNNCIFIKNPQQISSYDIYTGSKNWSFAIPNSSKCVPLFKDDKIYIGAEDNYLYCLDSSTGEVVWKSRTNDKVRERPSIDNGRVYFGSLDSCIYVLDSRNGSRLWMHELDSPISSPPMIKNDMLYLATANGNLYSFKRKGEKK